MRRKKFAIGFTTIMLTVSGICILLGMSRAEAVSSKEQITVKQNKILQ